MGSDRPASKTCRNAVLYALLFASGVMFEFGRFNFVLSPIERLRDAMSPFD